MISGAPLFSKNKNNSSAPLILVVDDDPDIREMNRTILEGEGYRIKTSNGPEEALLVLQKIQPGLIISDIMMPEMDGFEFCRILREEQGRIIPFLFLTCLSDEKSKLRGFSAGADDYLVKPFSAGDLVRKTASILRRARWNLDLNPLTELPGNTLILRELNHRLEEDGDLAALYIDIDNFKAYNDVYGFSEGDKAILLLASILERLRLEDRRIEFLGHIGGDDFVMILQSGAAEEIARTVIKLFDSERAILYKEEDLERGGVEVTDRRGEPKNAPLMTLSIGAIENKTARIRDYRQFAGVLTEAKSIAKQTVGSSFFTERRGYS